MQFTYQAYTDLLALLSGEGYTFCNYHDYQRASRCVILRHDIDNDLNAAVKLAELEADMRVSSTFFVLLRTDFYNPASQRSQDQLHHILALGHEIGLHFDEVAYGRELTGEEIVQCVVKECGLLSTLLDTEVSTASMHRPSKSTLDSDLQIPGIINSYGQTFFHDFKYLSDSRRRWREPVLDIVRSGEYDRLHILTHAFWYHEAEQSIGETVKCYIRSANAQRYDQMRENITDLESITGKEACI